MKKIKNKTAKKLAGHGLDMGKYQDRWSAIQGDLQALAAEQVSADISLVESTRALAAAQVAHQKAVARKTTAEKQLSQVRANLGAE